jgi:uncharacterized protein YbaR (Trm112 family)
MTVTSEKEALKIIRAFENALFKGEMVRFQVSYEWEGHHQVDTDYESTLLREAQCPNCSGVDLRVFSYSRQESVPGGSFEATHEMVYCPSCDRGYILSLDPTSQRVKEEKSMLDSQTIIKDRRKTPFF